ncbi:HAD-IB family hydrolase [Nocardia harenae]|uniref:HAD-IB family hydrolase n=1 Tax=Nocardia harenae TaxID=358707 RepID=UPI00082E549B|nr:HAD-IB family hydrolase [Nocardia harenae]
MSAAAQREDSLPAAAPAGSVGELLEAIRTGPQGPRVAVFFDFAGTVVDGFRRPGPLSRLLTGRRPHDPAHTLRDSIRAGATDGEYGRFLQAAQHTLAGCTEDDLTAAGRALFKTELYEQVFPEAWTLAQAHREAGHTVVLISSLTRFQLRPVADELGIEHLLCTEFAVDGGVLTGYPDGKPLWRTGKADAALAFAEANGIQLEHSWVYADSLTDLPLLELAGHPVAVAPDTRLALIAAERRWAALAFRPRRPPTPLDAVRTAAGFAAMLGGALLGVLARSYTGQRRKMADGLLAFATRGVLTTTGVRLRVTGTEHARSPRPAVFLFNHQSQYDIFIVPRVLNGGVTGVGKQELTKNPIFGPLMRFVGVTFIDRTSTDSAKASLAPVVRTLGEGLSIAIAPEGTRSYTPQVAPFKKGAFHIAIQAGVPVIPIVIRNAGEVCRRNAALARPGVVDVAILPPIDVSGWDPAALDEKVEQVRRQYLHTLLHWPEEKP